MSTAPTGRDVGTDLTLLDEVIEQIMRSCADLDTLAWFTEAEPQPAVAAAAVGRLLRNHPHLRLVAGSPLAVWAGGGTLDPQWRSGYPAAPDSAWANLQFLSQMYEPDVTEPAGDSATRLLTLQEHSAADLAAR